MEIVIPYSVKSIGAFAFGNGVGIINAMRAQSHTSMPFENDMKFELK